MKIAAGCLGVIAIGLLSMGLAKTIGSIPIAWCIGYFTAVAFVNIDRHLFSRWRK